MKAYWGSGFITPRFKKYDSSEYNKMEKNDAWAIPT
jgi:hypothetical protein